MEDLFNNNFETLAQSWYLTVEENDGVKYELNQKKIEDITVICYFDDPILPYALKEIIN